MQKVFYRHHHLRDQFFKQVYENPFDTNCNYVINGLKSINYFKKQSQQTLKRLYYKSAKKYYIQGQQLFDIGDASDNIYIVLLGALEVGISDGNDY